MLMGIVIVWRAFSLLIVPNLELDILFWWRKNGNKFLILDIVATYVLVVFVSTIASKFAFSIGGRVVSLHRSQLHLEAIKA